MCEERLVYDFMSYLQILTYKAIVLFYISDCLTQDADI